VIHFKVVIFDDKILCLEKRKTQKMNHSSTAKSSVCRFLKAKNSFGMLEEGSSWQGIEDPNTTFWCIKSSAPVGPDNGIVGAKQCVEGRKCFKK